MIEDIEIEDGNLIVTKTSSSQGRTFVGWVVVLNGHLTIMAHNFCFSDKGMVDTPPVTWAAKLYQDDKGKLILENR